VTATTDDHDASFSRREIEEIETQAAVRPPVVFELIRRQGEEELKRPTSALALSGLVAGVAIGLSVLAEALLRVHLPDAGWRPLVENLGYSVGFVVVIVGQMQLFTENTITPVCSVLERPTWPMLGRLARIWSVVLAANVAGAALFAAFFLQPGVVAPPVLAAMLDISAHATGHPPLQTLLRGVAAGWMIAALVWMMPTAGGAKATLIVLMTWLIALADFAHIVAGSAEAALLWLDGRRDAAPLLLGFFLPALAGNVLGGSALFTALVWGQIRVELPSGNAARPPR